MLKLYRSYELRKEYWETWEDREGVHTVHWGELGTRGQVKAVKSTRELSATEAIQTEIDARVSEGFASVDPEIKLR